LQYYIPDLAAANKSKKPQFKLEYTTFPVTRLHPPAQAPTQTNGSSEAGAFEFRYPIPLKRLPRSLRNSSRSRSKLAPYKMDDLTVRSWTKLATKLGRDEKKKLREKFRRYLYVGGDGEGSSHGKGGRTG
jgi:endopolyphosphatase